MEEMEAGTELTIAYIEFMQTKERRQFALRHTFGFVCTCSTCSLDPEALAQSDARRVAIKDIQDSTKALRISNPLKLIQDSKTALKLMEEEGIRQTRADLAFECLNVCSYNGDRLNTNLWIEKALEFDRCESGVWSSMFRQIASWKGNPTRHPGWSQFTYLSGKRVLEGS